MKHEKVSSPRLSEELEERLRPNRYLGYDRDSLGVALLRREMFTAAESQFRRAVYLNPYEPAFRQHLAWCLHRMGQDAEAIAIIEESLRLKPNDPDALMAREKILESIEKCKRPLSQPRRRHCEAAASPNTFR
jgi:tetratricopeptide (TPR) repeat protein